jgi:hypothetical protein
LAEQHLELKREEGEVHKLGAKSIDKKAENLALVHLAGRTNPICKCHAASGLPVMVHLNGLARVRLK